MSPIVEAVEKNVPIPSGKVVLAARGLSVGHGGSVAYVQKLDLEVGQGEIVALLGANGAGKTTTLMGLAGLLTAQEGTVELDGETVATPLHSRARDGLSFVTQERCVFMSLTVRDNLRVGGCDESALDYFPELKPHYSRTVGLLSGGQQQMLAVARAIARHPKVLLADELSLGLAPMLVDRILEALVEACRNENLGVLLVEQQVTKVIGIADRGVVLRRGRLELTDTAASLRGRMDEVRRLYL
ncbi:ABC transporter ATP-binding protein [Embleya scabrispora]|uniref:ABC transporter ATP-binding protein n=1 Tax=Embleya scabrispora TaxID=159449 RepID=UPI00036B59BF|nr:ATP-binding cassette domain-containing protein [Embleya scabrispora]MYS79217.1 ATP-binding cassette domain-containing protein [Streptomyces sp. SID5474]